MNTEDAIVAREPCRLGGLARAHHHSTLLQPSHQPLTLVHPCPCCGFATLAEPLGSYDICDVCGWEDDEVQERWPHYRGGANHESLCEAQAAYLRQAVSHTQSPGGAQRHPAWRPLRPEDCVDAADDPDRAPYVYYWDRGVAGF